MKYEVKLVRTVTHTATVTLSAEDEDSAVEAAKAQVDPVEWELDGEDVDVTDVVEIEEDDEDPDDEEAA